MSLTCAHGTRCAIHAGELVAAPIFYFTVPLREVMRSVGC